jgi:hypothetical protein
MVHAIEGRVKRKRYFKTISLSELKKELKPKKPPKKVKDKPAR